MSRLKGVVILETVIILVLSSFLIWTHFINPTGSATQQVAYCDKYMYEDKSCLLSPKIYTGILPAESYLIFNFKSLQQDVQNYLVNNNLNSSVSVYILNMRNDVSFGINANEGFEPASLNKLPIAIIILKKVEKGELTLDTYLPINDIDRDDKSGNLYNTPLDKMKIKDLLYYMLSESDNTAFRVLEEQITFDDLQGLSSYLNYYTKDIDYTITNHVYEITPKSTANLFLSLYLSTDLKPENSELILSSLTNTASDEFNVKKVSNLPINVTVADKYGSYYSNDKSFFHDCGIMYIEDSRMFYCVMTKNLDEEIASNTIGAIVNKVYNYVIEKRKVNDLQI
jgi:beta-lactamase class A